MNVALKKVVKGMRKCPQVIPARSNSGLGIEAHSRTVMNPYFCSMLKINSFSLSIRGRLPVGFRCSSFSISLSYSCSSSTSETLSFNSNYSSYSSSSSFSLNLPLSLSFFSCVSSICLSLADTSAACLAMKYGGSSPRAVPNPQRKASTCTARSIVRKLISLVLGSE